MHVNSMRHNGLKIEKKCNENGCILDWNYQDTVPCHQGILNSIEERNEQHQGSWEEHPTTSKYEKKMTRESSNKCYENF